MKTNLPISPGNASGALKMLLAVVLVSAIVWGCSDEPTEIPDLNATVTFVDEKLTIENPTDKDWNNVDILIDEDFAYHVDKIPANDVVIIDLIKFENEENLPFPAGMRTPESILIESDMGRYWGEFETKTIEVEDTTTEEEMQ